VFKRRNARATHRLGGGPIESVALPPTALHTGLMTSFDDVWDRIRRCAGQTFSTATGLPFTYRVPGDYLRVERDGREINRSLSRTNFEKAAKLMPAATPSDIKGSQGSAYTWGILMDKRIRQGDW
jgi:hypothetical protein